MKKTAKDSTSKDTPTSRRDFMKSALIGAGATAALGPTGLSAQEGPDAITIPEEFEVAERASLPEIDFPHVGCPGLRAGVQGRGHRRSVLLSRELRHRARDRGYRHPDVRWSERGLHGPRRGRLLQGHTVRSPPRPVRKDPASPT